LSRVVTYLTMLVKSGSQLQWILPHLRFQFRFSLWHIVVGRLQTAHVWIISLWASNIHSRVFTANCQTSTLSHFFGDCHIVNLAVCGKTLSELLQWKENMIFTLVYCSYWLISMLWIYCRSGLVWITMIFWLDPVLERAVEVCSGILSLRAKLESELWRNPPNLRTWFYIYGCSKGHSFKMADF
jgi:hypothetical protein